MVPDDENVVISTNTGDPIVLKFENSLAGRAYLNIAKRIMGEDVEYLNLFEQKNLFQRLMKAIKGN